MASCLNKKAPSGRFFCGLPGDQAPAGMPEGWIQPICHEMSTQMNSKMENPTRNAKARAMLPFGRGVSSEVLAPPRIMYTKAMARLARIATKANATRIFMKAIIQ